MASSKYSQRPRAPSPPGPSPIRQGATPHHRDNFAFLRQQQHSGGAGHESDTHAYSTVDGPPPPARMSQRPSVPPPAVPPKNRIDRMFGDSHGEESSNEASGNLSAYTKLVFRNEFPPFHGQNCIPSPSDQYKTYELVCVETDTMSDHILILLQN